MLKSPPDVIRDDIHHALTVALECQTGILAVLALTTSNSAIREVMPAMHLPAILVPTAVPTCSGPVSVAHTRTEFVLKGNVRQATMVRKVMRDGVLSVETQTAWISAPKNCLCR